MYVKIIKNLDTYKDYYRHFEFKWSDKIFEPLNLPPGSKPIYDPETGKPDDGKYYIIKIEKNVQYLIKKEDCIILPEFTKKNRYQILKDQSCK